MPSLIMQRSEVSDFLLEVFPEVFPPEGGAFTLEDIALNEAKVCLQADATHLRPGGTVSGPSLMALGDLAMYAVILAHAGPLALAVTSNFNINFLRKPTTGAIIGKAQLLKLGRTLAVGDVMMYPKEEPEKLVAHATATYALPRKSE